MNTAYLAGMLKHNTPAIAMDQREAFVAETRRQEAEREKRKTERGVRAQAGSRNDAGLDGHGQARGRALLRGHPTPDSRRR